MAVEDGQEQGRSGRSHGARGGLRAWTRLPRKAWWDSVWATWWLSVALVGLAAVLVLAPLPAQAQLTEVHEWQRSADGQAFTITEYRRVDFACQGERAKTVCERPMWQVRPDQVSGVRLSVSDDGEHYRPAARRHGDDNGRALAPWVVLFEPVTQRYARYEWVGRVQGVPGVASQFRVTGQAALQGARLEVRWPADVDLAFKPRGLQELDAESAPGRRVFAVPPGRVGHGASASVVYALVKPIKDWAFTARRFQPAPQRPLADLSQWIVSTVVAQEARAPAELKDSVKAQAIYRWVLENVFITADRRWWRYGSDAVSPLEEVLRFGQGDSKAVSNLLAHLLRSAGIDADIVDIAPEHIDTAPFVPAVFVQSGVHLPTLDLYIDPAAGPDGFGQIGLAERVTVFNTRTAQVEWVTQ